MNNFSILNVRIDNFKKSDLLKKVDFFLDEKRFHQIATVNPEFILEAQKNKKFHQAINDCDLCVADGVGIFFAFLRFGRFLKCRMTGVDLMQEILGLAQEKNLSIFLAASKKGLSKWQETKKAILKNYPKLKISGANIDFGEISRVPWSKVDVIFASFGAPEQEIFLSSLKEANNAKIRLAMGVGGSFDYLTGKIPRAPKFARILGLEWLWRLAAEPRYRFRRIFRAVIIFPIKVLINR